MQNKDDFKLIDEFIEGDSKAFNTLAERYKRKIYMTAYRILGNHEDADDITQEVIIKMYNNLNNFRKESSIFTWLYKITTNLSLNELKRKKLNNFFSLDTIEGYLAEEKTSSVEVRISHRELSKQIQNAINKLPPKQRVVFTLRFYEELPYEEISKILGTSVGALKANYFHAFNKMVKELKMSCEKIRPLLIEYFEKNISETRLKNLKLHLETCENCTEKLSEFEKLSQVLKSENKELLDKRYFYFENLRFNNSKEPAAVSERKIPLFRYSAGFAVLISFGAFLLASNFIKWNSSSDEFQAARLFYPDSQSELISDNSYNNLTKLYDQIADETIIESDYLKREFEILLQMNSKFIPGVESYFGKEYNLNGLDETDIEQIINSLIKKEFI
jgi:RNA polymerase sigma-70 factor (ECF subfamily)